MECTLSTTDSESTVTIGVSRAAEREVWEGRIAMTGRTRRALFASRRDSARDQMAEALLRTVKRGSYPAGDVL